VSAIFNYLLVCGLDGTDAGQFAGISEAFAAYVLVRADGIIGRLVRAHDCGTAAVGGGGGGGVDIALLCGSMLRSSLRHAPIYRWALSDPICERLVYPFLDAHVHNPNFDVSSDALETVRVMLTGNASASAAASSSSLGGIGTMGDAHAEENRQVMEGIASDFLNRKYADVVDDRVNRRCLSPDANYMTRRMTLQLLSSILLNRANYNVMMMYISSSRNLVTILCLLRDPSPHITLDAFQVFKIFVANPNKVSRLLRFIGARADAPFRT
jgi:calcium binding protein 39